MNSLRSRRSGISPRGFSLLIKQLKWQSRAFWRDPEAAFFVAGFPVILLVLFNTVFGKMFVKVIRAQYGSSRVPATFFLGTSLTFAVVNSMLSVSVIGIVAIRQQGVLKRVAATPYRPSAYLTAKLLHAFLVMLGILVMTSAISAVLYGTRLSSGSILGIGVLAAVSAPMFASLGLAISTFVRSTEATLPVVNALVLPMYFVSGVFVPSSMTPRVAQAISKYTPVGPVSTAMNNLLFQGRVSALHWSQVAVMAAWTVVGAIIWRLRADWNPRR